MSRTSGSKPGPVDGHLLLAYARLPGDKAPSLLDVARVPVYRHEGTTVLTWNLEPINLGEDLQRIKRYPEEDRLEAEVGAKPGLFDVRMSNLSHPPDDRSVRPGRPSVHKLDGVTIRVEARRIQEGSESKTALSPREACAIERTAPRKMLLTEGMIAYRRIQKVYDLAKTRVDDFFGRTFNNAKLAEHAHVALMRPLDRVLKDATRDLKTLERRGTKADVNLGRRLDLMRDQAQDIGELLAYYPPEVFDVQGSVQITAVQGHGSLRHWEVRFENEGSQPFIGTAVLAGANKNAGLGLESMAVPHRGSLATQQIRHGGNYGRVSPVAGTLVRVAVRGMGYAMMKLPKRGTVSLPVERFTEGLFEERAPGPYFTQENVEHKRARKYRECLDKVEFYDGDQRWRPGR